MSNTTTTPAPVAPRWDDADAEGFLSAAESEVSGIVLDFLKAQAIQKGINRRMLVAATRRQVLEAGASTLGFGVFLDKRGRLYYHGAGLAPQGKDFGRGLLVAAEGARLGLSGVRHLMCGVATTWGQRGLDKASMLVRVQGVKAMVRDGSLRRMVDGARQGSDFSWRLAEEPMQFLALAGDLLAAVDSGRPSDYVSATFIGYDATCSGLQILAAVTGCRDTARLVNVEPLADGSRADIYLSAAAALRTLCDEITAGWDASEAAEAAALLATAQAATDETRAAYVEGRNPDAAIIDAAKAVPAGDHWALYWQQANITRSVTKRPVMVYCYGGGKRTFAGAIREETKAPWKACMWLAATLYDRVLATLLPKAHAAMKAMQEAAKVLSQHGKPVAFTTTDGLPFVQAVMETEKARFEAPLADGRRIQGVLQRRTNKLDSARQQTGVAPNIVHHWDSLFLRNAVRALNAAGIVHFFMVHDCFYLRAGDWAKGWKIIRRVFVETFSGDVLADLWAGIEAAANGERRDPQAEAWENEGGALAPERPRTVLLPACPAKGDLDLTGALKSQFLFS